MQWERIILLFWLYKVYCDYMKSITDGTHVDKVCSIKKEKPTETIMYKISS